MLVDQPITAGSPRPYPSSETVTIPSTLSGSGSERIRRVAPTCPSAEPSTDASTSVFSDGRPSNTRASCSRAAVSDALPAESGTPEASRSATTTIWRPVSPARRPSTLTSFLPSRWKRSTSTVNPLSRKAAATSPAARRSPTVPARRSGAASTIRCAWVWAPTPSNTTSAGRPCSSGRGVLCSENITSTTAKTAGANATR